MYRSRSILNKLCKCHSGQNTQTVNVRLTYRIVIANGHRRKCHTAVGNYKRDARRWRFARVKIDELDNLHNEHTHGSAHDGQPEELAEAFALIDTQWTVHCRAACNVDIWVKLVTDYYANL